MVTWRERPSTQPCSIQNFKCAVLYALIALAAHREAFILAFSSLLMGTKSKNHFWNRFPPARRSIWSAFASLLLRLAYVIDFDAIERIPIDLAEHRHREPSPPSFPHTTRVDSIKVEQPVRRNGF